jgi:hypothetical protein
MLTRDPREVERKKYGRHKARKLRNTPSAKSRIGASARDMVFQAGRTAALICVRTTQLARAER